MPIVGGPLFLKITPALVKTPRKPWQSLFQPFPENRRFPDKMYRFFWDSQRFYFYGLAAAGKFWPIPSIGPDLCDPRTRRPIR